MNKAVTIGKVVRGGYCVGCGGCASGKSGVTMRINDIGMPEPVHPRLDDIAADSCPFGDAPDETRLANALYAGIPGIEHHPPPDSIHHSMQGTPWLARTVLREVPAG